MKHIGASVRALFGAYEGAVAELYRRAFFDMDVFVRQLAASVSPVRILEVGCGEGQMTSRLARAFPRAEILGIDVSPRLGRLFDGPSSRVTFRCRDVAEVARSEPAAFDLIMLCDVLHHVPLGARVPLLDSIRALLSAGGVFYFKDWERRQTPIHWACALSDRYITGDVVHYCTRRELRELVEHVFAQHAIVEQPPVAPWAHNRVISVRSLAAPHS